jgi:formate dehydrogenase maturation protein FdhE
MTDSKVKCPICGSDNVTQLTDHCSHGVNGYRCNLCGTEWGN